MKKEWLKKGALGFVLLSLVYGCVAPKENEESKATQQTTIKKLTNEQHDKKEKEEKEKIAKQKAKEAKALAEKKAAQEKAQKEAKEAAAKKIAQEKVQKEAAAKKAAEEKAQKEAATKKEIKNLANLEYQGVQTIEINDNVPTFSKSDLSLTNGAWEHYGDLDSLNRATQANAMLNQSLMPKEKRGDISSVTPTGWKNKRIASGYLYNRSHLIGFALAGENANWKNLITGTRQLNSPEMLRFEMDIKYYLEQDANRYVRYQVTPIFRGNELLARGVHLMAQSVGDNKISFNVYIFNVQDGVTLNYADGSSNVESVESTQSQTPAPSSQNEATQQQVSQEAQVYITPTGKKYHSRPHGNGHFTPVPLSRATANGLSPCRVCY